MNAVLKYRQPDTPESTTVIDSYQNLCFTTTWFASHGRYNEAISAVLTSLKERSYQAPNTSGNEKQAVNWVRYIALHITLASLFLECQQHLDAANVYARITMMVCCQPQTLGSGLGLSFGQGANSGLKGAAIPDLIKQLQKIAATEERISGVLLVPPETAAEYKTRIFSPSGTLPLVESIDRRDSSLGKKINDMAGTALQNLAKILQDGSSQKGHAQPVYLNGLPATPDDILLLYLLSFSLYPSAGVANNIGILLVHCGRSGGKSHEPVRKMALAYYHYGLTLDGDDRKHIHTNLGSFYREEGLPEQAIAYYKLALEIDPDFVVALTNMAHALQELPKTNNSSANACIMNAHYCYSRALALDPSDITALAGFTVYRTMLCHWFGRGATASESVGVDLNGNLVPVGGNSVYLPGWMMDAVSLVHRQIQDFTRWGGAPFGGLKSLQSVESAMKMLQWQWYHDRLTGHEKHATAYRYPEIPVEVTVPPEVVIQPFQAFTLPLSRTTSYLLSQMEASKVSVSTLKEIAYNLCPPPQPPPGGPESIPTLKVGYVSSDFTDHPLSHLMQSVFGLHNPARVVCYCYALSNNDGSSYRSRIEQSCYQFRNVANMTTEGIVSQIRADGIHILINLNGFTKGARNDIFACRPCPVQITMMGFAGPVAAGWCDYVLSDRIVAQPSFTADTAHRDRVILMPRTLFVSDHHQSQNDVLHIRAALGNQCDIATHSWDQELELRHKLRLQLFPTLPRDAVILGNFNQLYKIDPEVFVTWLRILDRVPNAYLWLLQFPEAGQKYLQHFARKWSSSSSSAPSRIIFAPVAQKDLHIYRSRVCDLFLDTPACNAHTTAADVTWAGVPILTYPRYEHNPCTRICASIISAVLGEKPLSDMLIVKSMQEYEDKAVWFVSTPSGSNDLRMLRKQIFQSRLTAGRFFDTELYVRELEQAFLQAWCAWVQNKHHDIHVESLTRSS